MSENDRALIAGVGQPWMRDLAFGSHVVQFLKRNSDARIDVLDLSFNPIAACELIEQGRYQRVVFIHARAAGRMRGALYEARPAQRPLSEHDVHAHIGDAVMGCISLDTLILVCRFRNVLPAATTIVEVEPEDEMWGSELSPGLQRLLVPAANLALLRARHLDTAIMESNGQPTRGL